ncbi:uncharacterized protein TNCV_3241171 [Trichonephila clavipes]|nr:uncharacterized protein TNCV_3241171 [Trichonephila clavipes]
MVSVVESQVRIPVTLKTHFVDRLMQVESVEAQNPQTLGWINSLERLNTCQNQISELLLGTEDAVQEYLDDMEDAENYRDRYIEMCTRVDLKIRETVVPTETEKRSFKDSRYGKHLPEIDFEILIFLKSPN